MNTDINYWLLAKVTHSGSQLTLVIWSPKPFSERKHEGSFQETEYDVRDEVGPE